MLVVLAVWLFSGSSSSSDTTTAVPTAATWANNVCTAFTTWQSELKKATDAVKTSPSKSSLEQGLTDAQDATKKLTDTLAGLPAPTTASSQAASAALQKLQTQLQDDVTAIKTAVDGVSGASSALEAVSKVSGTLATMGDQLTAAGTTLKSLPSGELKQAFTSDEACASL